MTTTKYPGWRTMTASQRYNAKLFRIFEDAKVLKQMYCGYGHGARIDGKCKECGEA